MDINASSLHSFHLKDLPPGEYRRMYFDRYARDDLMAIILQNYKNTQNEKHLSQLARISFLILIISFFIY